MARTKLTAAKAGFTLVELAIVLVIVGLVVGGVLVGQDLIRSAELRRFYSEKEKIILAVRAFQLRYNCLPGDCTNATQFFGTDPEGCPGPGTDKTPKTQTCNGDGNDIIGQNGMTPNNEELTYWQQLVAAGVWTGKFRGSLISSGTSVDSSVAPPISIAESTYWQASNTQTSPFDDGSLAQIPPLGNAFAQYGSSFLTPLEASVIDIKYDDAKPASGNIRMFNSAYTSDCTDENGDASVYLTLSIGIRSCLMGFVNVY
jgi:prepilin-type N-terminal cleavage/methylation domain-containing protein